MCCFPQNLSSAQQFNEQNIYFLHNFMYKYLFWTISWIFIFIYSIYVKFLYSLSLCMCSQLCIVVIVFIAYV